MTTNSKVEYVLKHSIDNPDGHKCHWPGCDVKVPAAMWGCRAHWYTLPAILRVKVWKEFRPGQEISKDPSSAYMKVAQEVQEWIERYMGTEEYERRVKES